MLSLADSNEPKYLIWSSSNSNKIKLHDLETKSECGEFQGAQAAGMATTWTHIRELGDTNMILSACYPNGSLDFANFEVFEISRGKLIPTFLFSKLDGVKGRGDLTYNKRRNFAALIPIQKNIAYHLFDCTTLKIICRSKWQKVHGDQIESFDLDSSGRRIATFDKGAVCSISDIDNNGKYIAHVKLDQSQGVDTRTNRCRWNPLAESSMIYLAHDVNKLNVYDFEKMELILKEPLKLEQPGKCTRWIDCRYDGNLLASAGWDGTTKIYDNRVGNIIKVIEGKDVCDGVLMVNISQLPMQMGMHIIQVFRLENILAFPANQI